MASSLSLLPSKGKQVSEVGETKEEKPLLTHNKIQELISTLPQRNDWQFLAPLCQYQGFWYPPYYIEGIMLAQENFKPQPTDVIISSHPKTGTTWLKALAFAIVTRSNFSDSSSPLLSKMSHDIVTYFEIDAVQNTNLMPKIPLVATHIPYTSLPKSVVDSGCKIVYICRDPKDVFVSFWHFQQNLKRPSSSNIISMEKAFKLFCEGVCNCGPYWEHVLGYWRASLELPERVLFVKYEDMKSKTLCYVKKLAKFMGYPFSSEEERQGIVQEIMAMCSFEKMRSLEISKNGEFRPNTPFAIHNSAFFRKGEIGDWQNHLTTEMRDLLDQITEQKLRGSGLHFLSCQAHE